VHAVGGVVLDVGEVHERRLGEVIIGEVQLADLGGEDRLGACGQR